MSIPTARCPAHEGARADAGAIAGTGVDPVQGDAFACPMAPDAAEN